MIMTRSVILLCCAIFSVNRANAEEEAIFTRQWTTNFTYKPEVVQVQDDVYLVTLKNYTINVTSLNPDSSSLACKLPVSSEKTVSSKINVVALGNGKILIRGSMTTSKDDSPCDKKLVEQLFVIVDPRDCSTIKVIEKFSSHPRYFEALVPYEDSFDLFYSTSKNSTEANSAVPKRYNVNGEPVQLDYSLVPDKYVPGMVIELRKPYQQSGGYFAAFIQDDGLISLKILDDHMKVLKEATSENSVDHLSTLYDNITYCYVTPGLFGKLTTKRQKIFCELLDADLKTKAKVQLYDPEGLYGVSADLVNLPGGDVIVAFAHKHRTSQANQKPVDFYLQRINSDGTTKEAVKLGTYPIYYFQMHGILHKNGEFCLVVVGESQPRTTPAMDLNFGVQMKCLDTTK